jgi:hypothetical protein
VFAENPIGQIAQWGGLAFLLLGRRNKKREKFKNEIYGCRDNNRLYRIDNPFTANNRSGKYGTVCPSWSDYENLGPDSAHVEPEATV